MSRRGLVTIALFFGFALVAFIAGCRRGSESLKIGVVPKATSSVFWLTVQAGVLEAGEKLGVEVEWNGPPRETDYTRQLQIVETMIARRLSGIAVAPAEQRILVQAVEKAMEQGIPVVVFDSGIETDKYVSYVATNNYLAGQMAARKLGQLLGGRGKVGLIMHAPGSVSTMEREQGFEDVLKKEFPGISVVARQFGMSDIARARAAAENILTAEPDLDGLFASSEPSTEGAALAIKSRGLGGKVAFVGFDFNDRLIEDLKAGVINALIIQDPFSMGYRAVEVLVSHLRGKKVPNLIQLEPKVLDMSNIDDPELQRILYPDLSKVKQR